MKFKSLKECYMDGDLTLDLPAPKNPVLDVLTGLEAKAEKEYYSGEAPPWDVEESE